MPLSISAITFSANAAEPFPPTTKALLTIAVTPLVKHKAFKASYSASVSSGNALIQTTGFNPNFWIFSMCFSKLQKPFAIAGTFSVLNSSALKPAWCFIALIVATKTTASGFNPDCPHFIWRNFSAPKSAPKPASVTT